MSKKRLHLAEGLDVPAETAATETFGMLAMRGYGKTYAAKVICEELLEAGDPIAVLDPLGVYWGLRVNKDGAGPGFENLVVLGGEHADLPLHAGMGEMVGEWCVKENRSVVLDLSLLRKGQQVQFATEFAETLFHRNRRPRMVVIDEAHTFVPQRVMGDMARCVGAFEDLITKGRVKGLGSILTSQRASVVNWNVLSQVSNLIALRTVASLDRDALKRWILSNDPQDRGDEMLRELASLDRGDAWVWCPGGDGWPQVFGRYHFRELRTYDSSKTPKRGEKQREAPPLRPVDLEQLRAQFASAVDEAEQNDPKALRRRIVSLEQQLLSARKESTPPPPAEVVYVPQPFIPDELLAEWAQMRAIFAQMTTTAREIHGDLRDRHAAIDGIIDRVQKLPAPEPPKPAAPPALPERPKPASANGPSEPARRPPAPPKGDLPADGLPELKSPALRLLKVAAERAPWKLTREQLAALADVKANTGSFRQYIPALRAHGFIVEERGLIEVTNAGFQRVGVFPPPQAESVEDAFRVWDGVLEGGPRKLMRILFENRPKRYSREALAKAADVKHTTGSFRQHIPLLRRLNIITENGNGIAFNDDLVTW